jgi:hypothetical protein
VAPRLTLAVLLVALAAACSNTRVIRLETGEGPPLEYRPQTWDQVVKVSGEGFEKALGLLVLQDPLAIRPAEKGWLVRTSTPSMSEDATAGYWVGKALGGPCRPGQPRAQCLSLLDDVMGLRPWEKLAVGLGLSLEPMRESIARALEDTMTPQFFATAIGAGVVSWAILAANPEPLFTKAAALVAAVMVIYLGVDAFLEVVKACQELKRASEQAVTFEELEEAGKRFGNKVGPQFTRVFILAVTVAVSRGTMGGSAWLAARLPLLPSFAEASALGRVQVGIWLPEVGQVSAVAVVEGNLVITLAPTAVAMVAQSIGGSSSPAAFRSWGSFSGFKSALGSAGTGKEWHHIVEQTEGNVQRFGPHALHNTQNVIPLEKELHTQISAFYSRKRFFITNSESLTVREWLSTQSFEAQRQFGLQAIENIKKGIWR